MAFYSWIKIASKEVSLLLYTHFECGLISRIGRMHMCCSSSLTGDLPSAVWLARLVPHMFVSRLLPDRRPAECGLAGKVGSAYVCVSRLLPDRRPAECGLAGRVGSACVCVSRLLPDRRVRSGRQGWFRMCLCVAAPP